MLHYFTDKQITLICVSDMNLTYFLFNFFYLNKPYKVYDSFY